MVGDLVEATTLANAAVHELKGAALDAETALNKRLEEADRLGVELANHITSGQQLMDKIAKITSLARGSQPLDDRMAEPNKAQSALSQLAMRPRIRGNAA